MILSYHVFDGRKWLGDDERTWTNDYHDCASFNDPKLAQDVGEREAKRNWGEDHSIYVMACMGWQS